MTTAPTTLACNHDAQRGSHCVQRLVVPSNFTRLTVENKQPKTNHSACESAAVNGCLRGKTVPDEDGSDLLTSRKTSIKTESVGKSHSVKAVAFWSRLAARRSQPGNCGRCGRPNPNGGRACPKCREYQQRYKLRLKEKAREYTPTECVAMVKQCRREVSKLREIIKKMQAVSRYKYNRQWKEKQTLKKYADAYPTITAQEAAEISHAYDTR